MLYFARLSALLNPLPTNKPGISPDAVIHTSTKIPGSCTIAEQVSIGRNVVLGDNVVIGPGCVVGDRVIIGEDTQLAGNVVVTETVLSVNAV